MELEKKVAKILPQNVLLQVINNTLQWSFVITITVALKDCAIIIRRGAEKLEGGPLHKIAAKMGGGAQSKITHLTEGGP